MRHPGWEDSALGESRPTRLYPRQHALVFRVEGQCLGFAVQGLRFRVKGSRFRVSGLGLYPRGTTFRPRPQQSCQQHDGFNTGAVSSNGVRKSEGNSMITKV